MKHILRIKNAFPGLFVGVIALSALTLLSGVIGFFGYGIANSEGGLALTILGSCAGAVIALWFDYLVAGLFYFAAADKGYTDGIYMYLAFIVPPVGYLLVCALPKLGAVAENHQCAVAATEQKNEKLTQPQPQYQQQQQQQQQQQYQLFVPPADTNKGDLKETLYIQYFNNGDSEKIVYTVDPYDDKYKIQNGEIQMHTRARERGTITFRHNFKKYVFRYDLEKSALLAVKCTPSGIEEISAQNND